MSERTKNILNIIFGIAMMFVLAFVVGIGAFPVYLAVPINFAIGFIVGNLIMELNNE